MKIVVSTLGAMKKVGEGLSPIHTLFYRHQNSSALRVWAILKSGDVVELEPQSGSALTAAQLLADFPSAIDTADGHIARVEV